MRKHRLSERRGQTTTEYLMIAGLLTAMLIVLVALAGRNLLYPRAGEAYCRHRAPGFLRIFSYMLASLAKSIFGSSNDRYVAKLRRIVETINAHEPTIAALTDEDIDWLAALPIELLIFEKIWLMLSETPGMMAPGVTVSAPPAPGVGDRRGASCSQRSGCGERAQPRLHSGGAMTTHYIASLPDRAQQAHRCLRQSLHAFATYAAHFDGFPVDGERRARPR